MNQSFSWKRTPEYKLLSWLTHEVAQRTPPLLSPTRLPSRSAPPRTVRPPSHAIMGRCQVAQRSRRVTKATLRYEQLCGQPIVSSPRNAHPRVRGLFGPRRESWSLHPGPVCFCAPESRQDYKRHLPLSIPRPTRCTGSAQARRPQPPLPSPRNGSSCICHHPSRHARSPRVPSPPVGGDLVSGPLLGLCVIIPPRPEPKVVTSAHFYQQAS